jgi:hypothetical protein
MLDLATDKCVDHGVVTLSCAPILIGYVLTWLFTFAGIAALFFVIFGGFKFITSGGEKEKVEEGRKTITWALVGMILIFLSFAIVRFIGETTGAVCISQPFNFTQTCETP